MEVFLGLLCPYSRDAWEDDLKPIAEKYSDRPDDVVVIIQQMILPYHRNAYMATEVNSFEKYSCS